VLVVGYATVFWIEKITNDQLEELLLDTSLVNTLLTNKLDLELFAQVFGCSSQISIDLLVVMVMVVVSTTTFELQ
jgi:hypothetical protein